MNDTDKTGLAHESVLLLAIVCAVMSDGSAALLCVTSDGGSYPDGNFWSEILDQWR